MKEETQEDLDKVAEDISTLADCFVTEDGARPKVWRGLVMNRATRRWILRYRDKPTLWRQQ